MDNPVVVTDVESRYRLLSPGERTLAEAWIGDAWDILVSARPSLPDDLEDELVTESAVRRAICSMVIRKLQNPDGKLEERGDDYSFRRDSSTSSGELYASGTDLDAVTPASSGSRHHSVRLVAYGES